MEPPQPVDPSAPAAGDDIVEHVPWERLTVGGPERPPWLPYAAAAAVIGLVAVAAWMLRPSPVSEVIPVAVVEPEPPALPAAAASAAAPGPPAPESPVAPAAPVVAEADLLAFVPVPGEAAARARAEWFVLEYFTSADPDWADRIAAALVGSPPASRPPSGTVTYVDWVGATATRTVAEGHYAVTVLYRPLISIDGAGYEPAPVAAVEVRVAVDPAGATVVTDLPTPVAVPAALDREPPPAVAGELPEGMAADLAAQLAGIVGDVAVVEAFRTEGEWTVRFDATDASGSVWRYSARLAGADGG